MKTKKILGMALLTAGLALSSVGVVNAADTTPPPTAKSPSAYTAQLAAYKTALLQYRIAITVNSINYRIALEKYSADWQAALAKYEAPYKAALAVYQPLHAAYVAKLSPISTARKTAMDKADSIFLVAQAASTSDAQMDKALKDHATATAAANADYKAGVAAIGTAPVKPVKPAELTKPVAPTKPANPVKPVAPVKPASTKK